MKALLIFLALTLSALAFGQDIVLKPGSSITITPDTTTTVSCEGAESAIPRCRIIPNGGAPTSLYNIEEVEGINRAVAYALTHKEAVERMLELKKLGMCK